MELGKIQKLKIKKITGNGCYLLDNENNEIFIKKEEVKNPKVGEFIEVFIYNGHNKDICATTKKPLAQVGDLKKLKIVEKSKYGYFVDIGIDKDILLPFGETQGRLQVGEKYLLYLFHDRSQRLALTMNIKDKLKLNENFQINDMVTGTIYAIGKVGYFVAVEDKYDGMIPKEEVKGLLVIGDEVQARVARVLTNGFITLTLREKAYKQMNVDAEQILKMLKDNGGTLYLGDKSTPEEVKEITGLSKSAFKRAQGALYKRRLIDLYDRKIILKNEK